MKTIILKLSGEVFSYGAANNCTVSISDIAKQIKQLHKEHNFGIVIGGGAFFRGASDGKRLNLRATTAHNIGMLATIMNGLILKDVLLKEGIISRLITAMPCPNIAKSLNQDYVDKTFKKKECVIFVGGTGNAFVTTDTNAVLKALYIDADEIWKATKVDGIYDADPISNPESKLIKEISYKEAIHKGLEFMDLTALALASKYKIPIRVFNLFSKQSLINADKNPDFGSKVYSQ